MNKIYIRKNITSKDLLTESLRNDYNITDYSLKYNENNKPYLQDKDLYFNISNKNDITVLVLSNMEIGVDIEYFVYNEKLAKKVCSKDELEVLDKVKNKEFYFTKMWVIKESYIKMLGLSIKEDLKKFDSTKLEEKMELIITDNYIICISNKGNFNM